ncbi:hypothetical protein [Clostridium lundense]|uniref:hypothetical protein n=1 Tax=Clostridium lundense TaxID=319475 RepID=UPI000483A8BB|nr:hypothetical protein [Clostridium lundense]
MDYKSEVDELLDDGDDYCDENKYTLALPLYEEAVKISSQYDDIVYQLHCRYRLTNAYVFCGDLMKGIINFSWCITQMEKGYVDDEILYQLLWQYKFLLDSAPKFIAVPTSKINELFQDMKEKYLKNNASLKSYYSEKVEAYMYGVTDDKVSDIREYYKMWISEPGDGEYENCTACTLSQKVSYHIFLGEYEKALKMAHTIINGVHTCAEQPHVTFAGLLLPLYVLEKHELAESLQIKGLRLVNRKKAFIKQLAYHIMYLSITNLEKAIQVFVANYPNFLKCNVDDYILWFNAASYVLFSKLNKIGLEKIRLKTPKTSPIYSNGDYDVNKLKEYFFNETEKFMDAFDKRNGNTVISEFVKRYLKICGC